MAKNLSPDREAAVMNKVRSEYAMQAVQELVERMTDKCFHKCTTKSGKKLESKEQECVAMCMDRYAEAMSLVQQTLSQRSSR